MQEFILCKNTVGIKCLFQGMKDIAKEKNNKQKTLEDVKAESVK